MIQLIILSLWFSMPFAYSRMYLPPTHIISDSDNCPGISEKLSDDCKMAIRCMAGGSSRIERCLRKGLQLETGACISDKFPSSSPCGQNLKARIDQCKKTPKAHLPDSTFCHLYYDCSDPTESKICPYPKLFSEESKRCEDFKRVNCGSRIEVKSYGQYKLCTRCKVSHPSCVGYPDGRSYHRYKKSPWYMACDWGRFVEEGLCGMTRDGPDPSCLLDNNKTTELRTEINCGGNENRHYTTKDCGRYVWCYYGRKHHYRCPAGTVFDKKRGSCQHLYDTCKPCGTKSC